MTQEYTLDLDKLREEMTQSLISIFDTIDEQMTSAEEKFTEFRPVTEGCALYHDTLLKVLDIEPTDDTTIPIIESLEDIYEGWHEENFSIERSWDEIRLLVKKMTEHGFT